MCLLPSACSKFNGTAFVGVATVAVVICDFTADLCAQTHIVATHCTMESSKMFRVVSNQAEAADCLLKAVQQGPHHAAAYKVQAKSLVATIKAGCCLTNDEISKLSIVAIALPRCTASDSESIIDALHNRTKFRKSDQDS